jgi:bacillithiol biosynthesis deacetylase BshB1
MDPLDVLAVVAHPDDAELLCGGSLLRCSDAGQRTGVLDLTRGDTGSRGTAELRAREFEKASPILGLPARRNAGLRESHLEHTSAFRKVVVELLRELRPRVVVTHWPHGRQPDHRAVAQLVYDASDLSELENHDASGTPFRPFKVLNALSFQEDPEKPTIAVDSTAQMDRKMEAIAACASQFGSVLQAGEVVPEGGQSIEDQIRSQAARAGSLIRTAHGEPFCTRETPSADTLGVLPVSTF